MFSCTDSIDTHLLRVEFVQQLMPLADLAHRCVCVLALIFTTENSLFCFVCVLGPQPSRPNEMILRTCLVFTVVYVLKQMPTREKVISVTNLSSENNW